MVKGIVRQIDELGRITIPKEMRRSLNINIKDPVDIYFRNGVICIVPVKLQCVCCGSSDEDKIIVKNEVHICMDCIIGLNEEVSG